MLDNKIIPIQSPEERELEIKRKKLEEIEDLLAQKEMELLSVQTEISFFEVEYMRIVGLKFAELDEIKAQINEKLSRKYPSDKLAHDKAREARKQAGESRSAYMNKDISSDKSFSPDDELKKLYRELVKNIHPDLTQNDDDKAIREELMKRANDAFRNCDKERLVEIMREWRTHPEHIEGDGVGSQLIKVIRKIAHVENRIDNITNSIQDLISSEPYRLMKKVEESILEGRNLLVEIAEDLENQISIARSQMRNI